jgi:hypothetical protein
MISGRCAELIVTLPTKADEKTRESELNLLDQLFKAIVFKFTGSEENSYMGSVIPADNHGSAASKILVLRDTGGGSFVSLAVYKLVSIVPQHSCS